MALDPQLVIMAKQPLIGRVKTRLARDIGHAEALRFFRSASESLIRRVGRDPRWQTVIAVSPDRAVHERGIWPDDLPRVGQGEGDLGHRMGSLFRDLPPGPVIIIGADIPAIGKKQVAAAFDALGRSDTVIGPAEDGGYWLIGMKRRPRVREIFEGVRWSSEHAMEDTLKNIRRQKMSVATLERLRDVDTGADLARWRAA
ncbi:TIGR04282 family arsenosugar biosynthesis glycosyltransferase [Parvibaculum sp.]|uniref:TIGR04282 family arsenosugar biosynthesis glycosyltransferase n=1 Tax=Parvibaculum sp. TaxID=2024848 RepID=UPI001AFF3EA4|nr:TIGR04282 family arsenosugar biosynthesis glycosyltransferase [Parvibaculum sp.]MBO6666967.1 TIGR04282 family arsenosugar biosynthesis glycosyltransferase [Parvibaculum sp.]MBO6690411.1 TIGR04282 family arsenosugar biosynthesis glycosyltransferase [Parvibaculum sp.]MBO6713588.1 TIGR04282 family arsenosugar biosynthesis glycosyltransferase [Parvibaculum sp.]